MCLWCLSEREQLVRGDRFRVVGRRMELQSIECLEVLGEQDRGRLFRGWGLVRDQIGFQEEWKFWEFLGRGGFFVVCFCVRMVYEFILSGEKVEGLLWIVYVYFRVQIVIFFSLWAVFFFFVWSYFCLRCGFSLGNRLRFVFEFYVYGLSFKLVGILIFCFYIFVFKNNVNI